MASLPAALRVLCLALVLALAVAQERWECSTPECAMQELTVLTSDGERCNFIHSGTTIYTHLVSYADRVVNGSIPQRLMLQAERACIDLCCASCGCMCVPEWAALSHCV